MHSFIPLRATRRGQKSDIQTSARSGKERERHLLGLWMLQSVNLRAPFAFIETLATLALQ